MSTASLLTLARLITKDPGDEQYTASDKYEMLSTGQEAVATYLHYSYLKQLHSESTFSNVASPGDFNLPTDFLRPVYVQADATPVKEINIEQKEKLRNTIEGGTDEQPVWYVYDSGGTLKGRVIKNTYPITQVSLFYVKKPPTLGASQEPLVVGLDFLILQYFKHLFHLAEGQADLAGVAIQTFFKTVDDLNSKLRM